MNLSFLDFKNSENRQKLLLGVFAIVILITVLVLYSFYFKNKSVPIAPVAPVTPLGTVREQRLNIEVLNNPIFQSLRKIGEYPVQVKEGELGRDNPFTPF